jgi:fluoride ion exporter CrcB/FEX
MPVWSPPAPTRQLATAALYAGGSVVLGIAAVWLGLRLVGLAAR